MAGLANAQCYVIVELEDSQDAQKSTRRAGLSAGTEAICGPGKSGKRLRVRSGKRREEKSGAALQQFSRCWDSAL